MPRYVRKRMFKKFDDDLFRKELKASKLEDILNIRDVNQATQILVDKLTKVLDIMAPVKTVQTR